MQNVAAAFCGVARRLLLEISDSFVYLNLK